ncbi:hypothetical protein E2C01_037244 [Portunus trituberculatus]|uniref:Uncharacterized protein n=1 Tax=Portunus trituberculatus TaxID=210409 RepID=A0A5B7FGJ5_PORTR|nr:hypothetical protein [Portunus trituberculatus]
MESQDLLALPVINLFYEWLFTPACLRQWYGARPVIVRCIIGARRPGRETRGSECAMKATCGLVYGNDVMVVEFGSEGAGGRHRRGSGSFRSHGGSLFVVVRVQFYETLSESDMRRPIPVRCSSGLCEPLVQGTSRRHGDARKSGGGDVRRGAVKEPRQYSRQGGAAFGTLQRPQ